MNFFLKILLFYILLQLHKIRNKPVALGVEKTAISRLDTVAGDLCNFVTVLHVSTGSFLPTTECKYPHLLGTVCEEQFLASPACRPGRDNVINKNDFPPH